MVDGPTSIERELSRGEALRELSRAQRQLLAALAALESDDRRDREAAALALDHAEARVAHAMAALDRLAEEPIDDVAPDAIGPDPDAAPEPDASGGRRPGRRSAVPLFEGSTAAQRGGGSEAVVTASSRERAGGSFGEEDLRGYLGELSTLARRCATDIGDLRALLHAAGELEPGAESRGVAPPEERGDAGAAARGDAERAARRRELLRQVAAELSTTAVDDLARSMADIDARLDAVARAVERRPEPAAHGAAGADAARLDLVERRVDARVAAVEERLVALERRVRWLEEAVRGESR